MHRPIAIAAALVLATALAASPATARQTATAATTAALDPWTLCADAVAAAERRAGIPDRLLTAISLAESGRRHPDRRANLAWPWTVMAEGDGQYLPSKAAAIGHIQRLQARGVRNIDVGCMQVNLMHHPDAFASLEQALDPVSNAGYAARFLTALRTETGSWQQATGRYHSATPERGSRYRAKVEAIWAGQPPSAPSAAGQATRTPPQAGKVITVDPARTARLNAARPAVIRGLRTLSKTLAAAEAAPARDPAAAARFAGRRREQLASWRDIRRRIDAERQARVAEPAAR